MTEEKKDAPSIDLSKNPQVDESLLLETAKIRNELAKHGVAVQGARYGLEPALGGRLIEAQSRRIVVQDRRPNS